MTFFNIIAMVGGLAFFLFGMNVLSTGLKKVAGNQLETVLQKMTDFPIKGLFLGIIITILMQSSSALTVMLVGLVNSGIMSLAQTVGIIMGSNIGTTLTAWILSLSGLETDNILLAMMKPTNFAPIVAIIGVVLIMAAKEQRKKDIGSVLVGFAILMHGMEVMSDSLAPLADMPEFANMLTAFNNPLLGVLMGTAFTAVIQSSAASVGVLQALSLTGAVSYGIAIPIIMGQNIGTCVTALLSSIGVSKNAKRVSVIHISFNLLGTAIGLVIYGVCSSLFHLPILQEAITPFAIAAFHSVFNVATTLILLPFTRQLVRIAENVIKDDETGEAFLDYRLLVTPAIATSECRKKTSEIMEKAKNGVELSIDLINNYNSEKSDEIKQMEEAVDEMVEACNQFLIQLSSKNISKDDNLLIADMLHDLGDMERISDYSLGLVGIAKKINKTGFENKNELVETLRQVNEKLKNILNETTMVYGAKDSRLAKKTLSKANDLVSEIKHMKKMDLKVLRNGGGKPEASVYLTDYLTICRRVTEHSINIIESEL